MKAIKLIVAYAMLSIGVLIPASTPAARIEGVTFSEVYQHEDLQLPIQGTGVFRFMGLFKVYVGALYHEAGLSPEQILENRAKRLEVEYFYAIRGSDFGPITNKILARNVDAPIMEKIQSQVDFHNAMYRDVRPGDRYALTYIPGRGTELSLNGEVLGVIEGAQFAAALFSVWLGNDPMNTALKAQLLGVD